MASEKIFNGTISYLKVVFLFGSLMCFVLMFFIGFDPWHSLDSMIWSDLYGQKTLPENCKSAFELPFLLFSWLSVLSMLMLYFISKYPLAQKQQWAFWCIVLIGIFWPGGAAVITYYTQAWSYFVSVGMMTLMFFPPVLLLYPHFRNRK
jgi:hypothetical protein